MTKAEYRDYLDNNYKCICAFKFIKLTHCTGCLLTIIYEIDQKAYKDTEEIKKLQIELAQYKLTDTLGPADNTPRNKYILDLPEDL